MSLLVELAEKAHVSVEGVVRVLTREPVSDAVKERVLAVLDELGPDETRVLQRFALAAVYDVLPRPPGPTGASVEQERVEVWAGEPGRDEHWSQEPEPEERESEAPHAEESRADEPQVEEAEPELHSEPELDPEPAAAELVRTTEPAGDVVAPGADAGHLVQLTSVLEDLAEAVRDLRRETDTERRERVDDLAVLIELISTGWQGLDRRLGRLERQLGRLEPGKPQPPPPVARPPQPEPPRAPAPVLPQEEPPARGRRDRLPLGAGLVLLGIVTGALAAFQFASADPDVVSPIAASGSLESVAATSEGATTTLTPPEEPADTTAAPARRPPRTKSTPTTTSAVLGTEITPTTAPQRTVEAPTQPARTSPPDRSPSAPAAGTGETGETTVADQGDGPPRAWAWTRVPDAEYYDVVFFYKGRELYQATTGGTQLTLPDAIVFRPGLYRWVVRPGFGAPASNRLGAPIVDAPFTVR